MEVGKNGIEQNQKTNESMAMTGALGNVFLDIIKQTINNPNVKSKIDEVVNSLLIKNKIEW